MKWLRITHEGRPRYGRFLDDGSVALASGAPWASGTTTGERIDFDERALLVPTEPSKIVCVGRNYRAHAKELGNEVPSEPLLFLKPSSSLTSQNSTLLWPAASERVEYEGELAAVIGKRISRVSPAEALEAVFGFTCANDVTARDLQRKDVQFTRAKGFDTFCPCGPWIETDVALNACEITTTVNGERRQHGRISDMVFPVAELLSYISHVMTLEPGDLVLTGTPEGVGPLASGDQCTVSITGIGALTVTMGAKP
jgi:2-keto-4-pentenoate hydratase/2-oxohepta-3-ene-1,7-dioic acid hydratase in catechol pathway